MISTTKIFALIVALLESNAQRFVSCLLWSFTEPSYHHNCCAATKKKTLDGGQNQNDMLSLGVVGKFMLLTFKICFCQLDSEKAQGPPLCSCNSILSCTRLLKCAYSSKIQPALCPSPRKSCVVFGLPF